MRRRSSLPSSLVVGLTAFVLVLQADASPPALFKSTALLQGTVVDQNGAVVPGARVSARNAATGFERMIETDGAGHYRIAALPVGNYRVQSTANGFRTGIVEHLNVEVARIVAQDFRLDFSNIDFSTLKNIDLSEDVRLQFHAEIFDCLITPASAGPAGSSAAELSERLLTRASRRAIRARRDSCSLL